MIAVELACIVLIPAAEVLGDAIQDEQLRGRIRAFYKGLSEDGNKPVSIRWELVRPDDMPARGFEVAK